MSHIYNTITQNIKILFFKARPRLAAIEWFAPPPKWLIETNRGITFLDGPSGSHFQVAPEALSELSFSKRGLVGLRTRQDLICLPQDRLRSCKQSIAYNRVAHPDLAPRLKHSSSGTTRCPTAPTRKPKKPDWRRVKPRW